MVLYFSTPNNTKYLVPPNSLIESSTLLNIICNRFAPIKVLHEMLLMKIFFHGFSSKNILSKSKSSILIMQLCHIITCTMFNTNFFQIITFHFYIVSAAISFCFDLCFV